MEIIRKALDLAQLERSRTGEAKRVEPTVREFPEESEANPPPPPRSIVHHITKVFTAPADVLERNRIIHPGSNTAAAAAFRMLRTQVLQRMERNGWHSLAMLSPGPNDGKTTTAINLAISIANDHRHTALLVDFDFKRPTLASRLGLAPERGSDDLLRGTANVEDCLYHPDTFDRLVVLPAREPMSHSSEILAGPRCRAIVKEISARYADRIVIYDLPPVLHADDALAFTPLVECGLVVVAESHTRRNDLARTIELLHKTPIVGTVLNRAAEAVKGY